LFAAQEVMDVVVIGLICSVWLLFGYGVGCIIDFWLQNIANE